jgi:8-oxo-dGTP pyrophosphatase MutT (NUDIX family)
MLITGDIICSSMRTIHREIVAAMIFSQEGKLLLVKKNPGGGGVYIDCWHIPGGGVNEYETKIEAVAREVREEVGLDINSYKVKLIDDQGNGTSEKMLRDTNEKVMVAMHFTVYQVAINNKISQAIKIILGDELVSYHWFALDELKSVTLTPPSHTLFTKLGYV